MYWARTGYCMCVYVSKMNTYTLRIYPAILFRARVQCKSLAKRSVPSVKPLQAIIRRDRLLDISRYGDTSV